MNFSGWVAIPRSVLNYTHNSKLSNTEQLVLLTLMLLADSRTGSGYTNAAAIRAYLPDLKYDTAKRVLKSLEDKQLIFRQIIHASKDVYPFWLHGYQVSSGPNKMLWTNLSQVFVTRDISTMQYDSDAPEITPDTYPDNPPETHPDDALKNKNNNDKDKDTHKDNPLYPSKGEFEVREKVSANVSESVSQTCGRGECEDARKGEFEDTRNDAWHLPPGYELKENGYAGPGVYGPYGLKLSPIDVANLERAR